MTDIETPTRTPSAESEDDTILPFEVAALDLRGRVVRLGPAVDEILSRHDYPLPVAKLLGEAIALAALFGSALKFDGRFMLQTQTDGPVRMLVVDYATSGNMRACARFDKSAGRGRDRGRRDLVRSVARPRSSRDDDRPGRRHEPLSGRGRAGRRRASKRSRTNISAAPNRFRPACGSRSPRNSARARAAPSIAGARAACCCNSCRKAAERMRGADLDPGDAPEGIELPETPDDDAWVEGRSLMETVEDLELIDPALSTRAAAVPPVPRARRARVRAARMCRRNAPARATACRRCCEASRRPIATTWSKTA